MALAGTSSDIEINFRALILAVIVGVSCSLLKRSSDSGSDLVTGWCHLHVRAPLRFLLNAPLTYSICNVFGYIFRYLFT